MALRLLAPIVAAGFDDAVVARAVDERVHARIGTGSAPLERKPIKRRQKHFGMRQVKK